MRLAATLRILARPWIWSYLGALLVWLAAIIFTHGYGAGGMLTAGLALAVFSVIAGVAPRHCRARHPTGVQESREPRAEKGEQRLP